MRRDVNVCPSRGLQQIKLYAYRVRSSEMNISAVGKRRCLQMPVESVSVCLCVSQVEVVKRPLLCPLTALLVIVTLVFLTPIPK